MHYCMANFQRPAVPRQTKTEDEGGCNQWENHDTLPYFPGNVVSRSIVLQSHFRKQNENESGAFFLVHFLLTTSNLKDFIVAIWPLIFNKNV